MTKLTYYNQMEKFSRICFEYLIYPWDCTQYEYDTGIDLIVQPYDEKQRDPNDNSLPPFQKRFLVQLKSTKKEEIDVKLNIGKLKIDTKHLLYWNGQSDPVMIARYYFNHGCFYYNWVDEIKINTAVEQQTICLPYKIDNIQNNLDNTVYQEVVKENILEKLIPPEVIDLVYVPNSPTTGIGYVTIDKIRNGQQIHKLLKSELLNQLIEEVTIKSEIQKIKSQLLVESENVTNRFRLALLYVKVGKMEEALSELNLLIYNFKMIEAKIIFSLITNREISILENLGNYNFGYYFKMGDEFPDNAEVEMTIDGELFKIGAYNKQGIISQNKDF